LLSDSTDDEILGDFVVVGVLTILFGEAGRKGVLEEGACCKTSDKALEAALNTSVARTILSCSERRVSSCFSVGAWHTIAFAAALALVDLKAFKRVGAVFEPVDFRTFLRSLELPSTLAFPFNPRRIWREETVASEKDDDDLMACFTDSTIESEIKDFTAMDALRKSGWIGS
jgi:hypothetical protein